MSSYPLKSININGREVEINSIISNSAHPSSEFETHTFSFIKEWLGEQNTFAINTSGSTGEPKTIIVKRQQLQFSAQLTINALQLKRQDSSLVCMNTQFIAGKMMLVRAFEGGMKIIAVDPSSNPLQNITSKIDFAAFVPIQIEAIINAGNRYIDLLNNMKAVIVGGAMISVKLRKEIERIKAPVYATFGMTETISHIALQRLNGNNTVPFYIPLPGVQIQSDQRGCLIIEAPYLPEKIITNDLVEISNGNTFRWLGRWDNVINTGGIKIVPEKLELEIGQLFRQLGLEQKFFVHSIPDDRLGNKLVLVVEGLGDKMREKLSSALQSFSEYQIPKEIIILSKFCFTKTGKINRKATFESLSRDN